ACYPMLSSLCFISFGAVRTLHSFPTRRSSDLVAHDIAFLPGEPRPIVAFDIGDWVYSQSTTAMERLRVVQWTLDVDAEYQATGRSEEHTSELQSRENLVCRLLLEKKNRPCLLH